MKFRAVYLNKPDKSDPDNKLRVLGLVIGSWFIRLRWSWPEFAAGQTKNG